jgi:hypothetical protein
MTPGDGTGSASRRLRVSQIMNISFWESKTSVLLPVGLKLSLITFSF